MQRDVGSIGDNGWLHVLPHACRRKLESRVVMTIVRVVEVEREKSCNVETREARVWKGMKRDIRV